MPIKVDTTGLQESEWHEYTIRFALGGLITVAAGLLAKEFGPAVGGLFLAFPAMMPATVTLVQKHEVERKREHGVSATKRGLDVAAATSAGTTLGSFGLIAFAVLFWRLAPHFQVAVAILLALMGWAITALAAWMVRKKYRFNRVGQKPLRG